MIYGVVPTSLIDYPGEMSYVIFLGGCNFKCHFCHNKDIVNKKTDTYTKQHVLKMLKERKGFINAVTITGGEPTIYGQKLIDLIKEIKSLGYKIKLDTNGGFPEVLKEIISNKLVDFIAMDIKNTFDKYNETSGTNVDIKKIKKSIKLIENSNIDYEFRTTINKEMHPLSSINEILTYVKDKNKLFFQRYRYTKQQINDIKYTEYSEEELEQLKDSLCINVR